MHSHTFRLQEKVLHKLGQYTNHCTCQAPQFGCGAEGQHGDSWDWALGEGVTALPTLLGCGSSSWWNNWPSLLPKVQGGQKQFALKAWLTAWPEFPSIFFLRNREKLEELSHCLDSDHKLLQSCWHAKFLDMRKNPMDYTTRHCGDTSLCTIWLLSSSVVKHPQGSLLCGRFVKKWSVTHSTNIL